MPSTLFRSKASSFSFQKAPYLGDSVNTALNLTPSKGWQHLPESNYCLLEALSLPGCLCFFPEHLLTLLWIANGFVQGPQIGDVLRLKGICSPYPTWLSSDVWMEEIFLSPVSCMLIVLAIERLWFYISPQVLVRKLLRGIIVCWSLTSSWWKTCRNLDISLLK